MPAFEHKHKSTPHHTTQHNTQQGRKQGEHRPRPQRTLLLAMLAVLAVLAVAKGARVVKAAAHAARRRVVVAAALKVLRLHRAAEVLVASTRCLGEPAARAMQCNA